MVQPNEVIESVFNTGCPVHGELGNRFLNHCYFIILQLNSYPINDSKAYSAFLP
jgi:hypothetical protein